MKSKPAPSSTESAAPGVVGTFNVGSGKLFLTKRELSEATGLPVRTLERLTANAVIPVLRITSRLIRYELPAVLAALRNYQTATLKK